MVIQDVNDARSFLRFIKCRIAGSKDTVKAACCVARQPNSLVWILGESVQIDGSGNLIEESNQEIVCVKAVFDMERAPRKEHSCPLPQIRLPLHFFALGDILVSLLNTIHYNFMAGVFTIGEKFWCMLYTTGWTTELCGGWVIWHRPDFFPNHFMLKQFFFSGHVHARYFFLSVTLFFQLTGRVQSFFGSSQI